MRLALKFALRYLFGRSRLGAANWVCALSVLAITLVSAALVIVLSIYNGYVELLLGGEKSFDPELVLKAGAGKTLSLRDKALKDFLQSKEVEAYSLQLEERGILKTESGEAIVQVCGLGEGSEKVFPLDGFLMEGYLPRFQEKSLALQGCAGIALSVENELNPLGAKEDSPYRLVFPKRKGLINPLAPATAFRSRSLNIVGVMTPMREDFDRKLFVELSAMQRLLDYSPEEATSIILKTNSKFGTKEELITLLKGKVPPAYKLLDREEQHPELSFLIKMEGFMVYLVMTFILLLAAFNLANGLSMLVIEKRNELDILTALGMPKAQQEQIFTLSGLFVSLLGVTLGVLLGLTLCYLQEQFGFISAGEGLIEQAFPIDIQAKDILLILSSNLLISLAITLFIKHIIKKFQ